MYLICTERLNGLHIRILWFPYMVSISLGFPYMVSISLGFPYMVMLPRHLNINAIVLEMALLCAAMDAALS